MSNNEQLALNINGLSNLDSIFDPMPMDYIGYLEKTKIVTPNFTESYKDFMSAIEQTVGHLNNQEENAFIKQNNLEFQRWRKIAKELLDELNNV